MRDRHRSEGTKRVLPQRDPAYRRGRLRHDRVDRRAAVEQRPHGDGRQLLRGDHAGPHRAREPAAPDRDLARRRADEHVPAPDARGRRDAAAHVLGALHPRRRRPGRAGDPEKQEEVWDDLRNLRQLFWEFPHERGTLALRHVPALDQTLEDYTTRGAYDEWWATKENDFTRFWHEHADIPVTMSTGWYDGFPHADTEYFSAMAPGARRRSGCSSGRGAMSACAATRPTRSTSTSAPTRAGACGATSTSSSTSSTAGCRTSRPGHGLGAGRQAGADLRHGRRQRP